MAITGFISLQLQLSSPFFVRWTVNSGRRTSRPRVDDASLLSLTDRLIKFAEDCRSRSDEKFCFASPVVSAPRANVIITITLLPRLAKDDQVTSGKGETEIDRHDR